MEREIFSYRWHRVVVCKNVTFAFVIVPHCKAKSSKGEGRGTKVSVSNFVENLREMGTGLLMASQWIFSF